MRTTLRRKTNAYLWVRTRYARVSTRRKPSERERAGKVDDSNVMGFATPSRADRQSSRTSFGDQRFFYSPFLANSARARDENDTTRRDETRTCTT